MRASYKLAEVMGIPIRLHVSAFILVGLVMLSFGMFQGLLFGAALLLSIVAHELAHSFVALRFGCRVREITLMCFGGAAQMTTVPKRPRDEFLMALAGPAVSVAIALPCIYGGAYLPLPALRGLEEFYHTVGMMRESRAGLTRRDWRRD
jgi:Zn-dependent protease